MLKRAFDILVSAGLLVLLAPVLVGVAIAIKLSSPGPILYRATRIGRHGVPFKLYKFRSMVVNADKIGAGITTAGDPRITAIGRFLRRTKLDELPQLINVLRGEMSLVGPRPEDPRYVALYTPAQRRILQVRPGITSLASVRYRHEEGLLTGNDWETVYLQQIMPHKLEIDLEYAQRATFLSDLGVLWQTFRAIWH